MEQGTGPIYGNEGEQFKFYSPASTKPWVAPYELGQELVIKENRYRFCRMGATAGAPGKLYQMELPDGNFDTLAVPSSTLNVVGSRSVRVTLPANSIALDLWAQGYMQVEAAAGAGKGYKYKIKTHPASAGSEDITITLVAGDGLQTALNTSDKLTFIKNPYADVIVHPSPPTAREVGVCCSVIPAGSYGWLQVGGICNVLIDGTVVIDQMVMPSTNTDGAVMAFALTEATPNTIIQPEVGRVVEVAPTTGYGSIWLTSLL